MPRKLLLGLAAVGSIVVSAPSEAVPISLELAIVIDSSGSISAANFATQQTSYVNALNALLPLDGSVAIEVINFASTVTVPFAEAIITNANFGALKTAIQNMPKLNTSTAIAQAATTEKRVGEEATITSAPRTAGVPWSTACVVKTTWPSVRFAIPRLGVA